MSAFKNILIIGASGNVGRPILDGITDAGFNVTVLSRASSKSEFPNHKVIRISDSYPHDELVKAFKGQDLVLSTITTRSLGEQKVFAQAAIEAGVRRFVPSEFGSDNTNDKLLSIATINRPKRAFNDWLATQEDKIEWTAVATGVFFDWGLLNYNFLGFDPKNKTALITAGGNARISAGSLAVIGRNVAKILLHPDQTKNRYVKIDSLEPTQNEILAALEKASGAKWEVKHQDPADLIARSRKGLEGGDHFAAVGLLQAGLFQEGQGGSHHADAVKNIQALGLEQEDLQTAVDKVWATAQKA